MTLNCTCYLFRGVSVAITRFGTRNTLRSTSWASERAAPGSVEPILDRVRRQKQNHVDRQPSFTFTPNSRATTCFLERKSTVRRLVCSCYFISITPAMRFCLPATGSSGRQTLLLAVPLQKWLPAFWVACFHIWGNENYSEPGKSVAIKNAWLHCTEI